MKDYYSDRTKIIQQKDALIQGLPYGAEYLSCRNALLGLEPSEKFYQAWARFREIENTLFQHPGNLPHIERACTEMTQALEALES